MATIIETVVGDRRLSLGNEEFVRGFAFGNNWNYLRVGLRFAVGGVATINTGQFMVGLCSGTTNTFNSVSTTDYFGTQVGGTTTLASTTLTYNAGPPAYYSTNSQFVTCRRVGNSNTVSGMGSNSYFVPALGSGTTRGLLLLDFKRLTATTISLTPWIAGSAASAQADTNPYHLWRCCENETNPFAIVGAGAGSATFTVGTSYDALSIYWNKSSPTIEISDVMVVRYA